MAAVRSGAAALPGPIAAAPNREFAFSEADFQTLIQLAYEHAGIALSESKQNLIYSRLSRRLRALRLKLFRDYCDYLATNASEVENFINSISTNHTKFFREAHHFDHFRATSRRRLGRRRRARAQSSAHLVSRMLDRRGAVHHCGSFAA